MLRSRPVLRVFQGGFRAARSQIARANMLLSNRQGDSATHFLPILKECRKCRNYNSGIALALRQATIINQSHQGRLFTAVPASPCFMKRPELMDASTRRFVEALLSPPPRDNWSRKLKATPLRTRANRSAAFQESPETRVPFIDKKRERGAKIETLADDLINLNCGTHSLGLIYEFFAKQFGEATGREEFIKYLSGDWSRNWVQAAAARVAEEQPNWSPPMPAPVRISNEDGANAGISSQRGTSSVNLHAQGHSLVEHSAEAVHP